jgi:hypothetical protein
MVVSRDFGGLDALPLALKLALIGRLVDGLNIDLDHVKGLIWEPEDPTGILPFLGAASGTFGTRNDDYEVNERNGRDYGQPTGPVPPPKPAVPLRAPMESPPSS